MRSKSDASLSSSSEETEPSQRLPLPKKDSVSNSLSELWRGFSRAGPEQFQKKQVWSQKSLLDLVTEDMPLDARTRSLAGIDENPLRGQKLNIGDQSKIKANPIPSRHFSLAQIVQQEKASTMSSSHGLSRELHFGVSRNAQTGSMCDSKNLSLSSLARLSSQAASSLRQADAGDKRTTLSDLSNQYTFASSHPSLSNLIGVHVTDSHATMRVGSSGSTPPAVSAISAGITFHKRNKFNVITLLLAEESVPHSLSALGQRVNVKLIQDYTKYVFKFFNFSSQSPDDVVRDKQGSVFQT